MGDFQQLASQAIHMVGGRLTAQRQLLITLLAASHTPVDADTLYRLARYHDNTINLATIYRTLNILETAGVIQPRYLYQDHERKSYEPVHLVTEYHLTCRNCKAVVVFSGEQVQALKHQLEQTSGFAISHACVCFSGLCPNCQKEQGNDSR